MGTNSSDFCSLNPAVEAALNAAREKQEMDDQRKILIVASVCGALILLLLLCGLCLLGRFTRLKARLAREEAFGQELKLAEQQKQIVYLRDWRIKEEDLTLESKVARGAEGEVWKGQLHGHLGDVAIKIANQIGAVYEEGSNVWDEREVAFMMSLHHSRLVTLVGAGELNDPNVGLCVFIVQVNSPHSAPHCINLPL